MMQLDENSSVLEWQSEEFYIPYFDPSANRMRRYFPDFWLRAKTPEGGIKTIIIEVKPKSQITPPKPSKNKQRYITEVMTWGTNTAKWEAAKKYCANRGWEFKIITEADLGISYK